jgi:nucleoside-diphosphate-sugar epimerase
MNPQDIVVDQLLREGHRVRVVDALLRPGSALNLAWLHKRYPNLLFIQGDVRDADRLWH